MEIGVFSRTYETDDLQETFSRMTHDGIYHTQFNFSNVGLQSLPEEIDDSTLEMIHTASNRFHVNIDVLTGTFNMIDPDESARARGIKQFSLQCRAARELGIPIVTLCTGSKNPESKWKWHDDNLKESSWTDLMNTTSQIIQVAEDNHIILGVETEASNIINTPERARKYLDEVGSPNLKIIMDGANLFHADQVQKMRDVLDNAFDLLGKDIVTAHATDLIFDGKVEFVAVGQGILDFPYYIMLLKKYGYNGPLTMHGLSERQIPESYRYLKRLL